MLLCFVFAGPQLGMELVLVPFQKPQHGALHGSVGHSQGSRQTVGGDCPGTLHPLTTTTKIALELSTTALGSREGSSALSLYYRPGLG